MPLQIGQDASYEQVMDALLAMLAGNATIASSFKTISRRFLMWEEVVQSIQNAVPLLQPALFLYDGVGLGGGVINYDPRSRGTPGVRIISKTIVIYARLPGGGSPTGPDSVTPGGTLFHPLIEAIEEAFVPDSEGAVTLGGLVSHCWLQGDGLLMTGEIDPGQGQGMATLPVRIMLYPSR